MVCHVAASASCLGPPVQLSSMETIVMVIALIIDVATGMLFLVMIINIIIFFFCMFMNIVTIIASASR